MTITLMWRTTAATVCHLLQLAITARQEVNTDTWLISLGVQIANNYRTSQANDHLQVRDKTGQNPSYGICKFYDIIKANKGMLNIEFLSISLAQ
jgi:hypothetical protein